MRALLACRRARAVATSVTSAAPLRLFSAASAAPGAAAAVHRKPTAAAAPTVQAVKPLNASSKMDYRRFLSRRSQRRRPSSIRLLQPLLSIPGMISLGGGMPNPSLFPFNKLTVRLDDGTQLDIEGKELDAALQYSPSFGMPPLVQQLLDFATHYHGPPHPSVNRGVVITTGSQDGLNKTFDMLLDEGDTILTENPTYSGALSSLLSVGCNAVGTPVDSDGVVPSAMDDLLTNWSTVHPNLPKPKVFYMVPTGQNPSGSTLSASRRRQVYDLACKHDLLLIEDDPYWFLRFPDANSEPVTSLMSLDTEGRVLRFDSFSKILSAGLRFGWVTGPAELIEQIQLDQQTSVLHPCGVSQAMVLSLLRKWGYQGLDAHIAKVAAEYRARRDHFIEGCNRYLTGLASWHVPTAGMFVWLKLLDIEDSESVIKQKALDKKVLMVPGNQFVPGYTTSPYVRAAFSTASYEQMHEALSRLGALLREERALRGLPVPSQ